MIKRSHLKHAIDAISGRDSEAGRFLAGMIERGEIDAPAPSSVHSEGKDPFFLIANRKVPVRKSIFINEGTAPIEQQLTAVYGERVRKEELVCRGKPVDTGEAALDIREAGLRAVVNHEIDYAVERIRNGESRERLSGFPDARELIAFLEDVRRREMPIETIGGAAGPPILYRGIVDADTPAFFMPFPYCMNTLMQVAGLNLEFFHVRFLLNRLADGSARNLFACMMKAGLEGLIYLALRREMFFKDLEIKYIATRRGKRKDDPFRTGRPVVKGAGTLLLAGTWMLLKTRFKEAGNIVLDSELGAIRFYESAGFRRRRRFEYILRELSGRLPEAVLLMANNHPEADPAVISGMDDLIKKQVKKLRKKTGTGESLGARRPPLAFLRECLSSGVHEEFRKTAIRALLRGKRKIPEAEDLIRFATERGLVLVDEGPVSATTARQVAVVQNGMFSRHLEKIFHIESPRRIEAIRAVMEDPSLQGRWSDIGPRPAEPDELAWVHTPEHIERVLKTAGRRLISFDMDTQATAMSWEVARLAVGAVFSLLDAIFSGEAQRGFACIRPPGHHAEPDRAMGFCLFNNIALGARYLQERYAVRKIMIVDLDAHHGNGTQAVFYDRDDVLFVSTHQFPSFPGTGGLGEVGRGKGEGFTVNIPLRKGHGDRDFAQIIHSLIRPLAMEFGPEIILVSCGFDLYLHDRLGGMQCTPAGYALMTFFLQEIAEQVCDGRIAFVMEGGYSVKGIRECGLRLMQELCGVQTLKAERIEKIRRSRISRLPPLRRAIEIHRKYWSLPHE